MELNITTDGYKILKSGTIVAIDAQADINFELKAVDGFSFNVILRFIDDNNKEKMLDKEIVENTIIFKCYNFNKLGTGTTKAISLATVDGKEWLIHFWSYILGDGGPRKLEYSIFERE